MNFQQSKTIGKQGEAVFSKRLEYKGFKVIDAREHSFFQEWDIDFVTEYGNTVYTIDVKTDSHPPRNFFIETISNDTKGTPGCVYQTRADFWIYVFPATDDGFVFKPSTMVKHIEENDFKEITSATTNRRGKSLYNSVGVLVPITNAPVLQRIERFSQFEQIGET